MVLFRVNINFLIISIISFIHSSVGGSIYESFPIYILIASIDDSFV